jgi:hypothetical protein
LNERTCDAPASEQLVHEVLQLLEARRFTDVVQQLSETLSSPSEAIEAAWPLLTRRLYVDGPLLVAACAGNAKSLGRVLRRVTTEAEAHSSLWTAESAADVLRSAAERENIPMPVVTSVVSIAIAFGRSPLPAVGVMRLLGQSECVRRMRHAYQYVESAHLVG